MFSSRSGLTPARKEYQYPRHLVTMSPADKILQRFRTGRSQVDSSDDEVSVKVSIPIRLLTMEHY